MDAPYLYTVRFWVAPEGETSLFGWLDGGHNAEVVSQPGFRFVRRVKFEQKSEDGWASYMMIYGVDSKEALERYFANAELSAKFTRERAPFVKHLRMDRAWGPVEMSLDSKPQ